MRNIREILRLHFEAKLSLRKISICTKASIGGVQKLLVKVKRCELSWPLPDDMDDEALAKLLYPKSDPRASHHYALPAWTDVHQELRGKGVTKHLLWEEYTQQYPNRSYSYSQYCHHYEVWRAKQRRSMRQIHKAGEKLFVDYAGQTVPIVSGSTGEVRSAQIFVAVMGASNYTFAEATYSQSLPDWLGSHARAFDFLGGIPELIIPDNLKSGMTKACRYESIRKINAIYYPL